MRKTLLTAMAIVAVGSVSTSALAGRDRGCDDDRGYRDSHRHSYRYVDDCFVQPRVSHCAPRRPAVRFHVNLDIRSHGNHRSYDRYRDDHRQYSHGGYRGGGR